MSNIEIEEYKKEYKNEVHNTLKTIFKDIRFELNLSNKDDDLNEIEEIYQNKKGQFWVLKINEKIVGTIALRNMNNYFELKRFFILKEYRGKGYGRVLLDNLLKYAIKNNIKIIRLDVDEKLKQAVHLYKKYGFYEIPAYNCSPFPNIKWMELKL